MPSQQQLVIQSYTDGFVAGNLSQILSCVTDDLVWEFNGSQIIDGKEGFAEHMRNDLSSGTPEITIERFVEQDDVVVAINRGRFVPGDGEPVEFVSAEMFGFSDGKICRIQTYQPMD